MRDAITRVSLSGRIGKPVLTLHGTRDALLPIGRDSDFHTQMVDAAGRDKRHRYQWSRTATTSTSSPTSSRT